MTKVDKNQSPTNSLGCVVCLNVDIGCLNVDDRCLNIDEVRVFYDEVPGVGNRHSVGVGKRAQGSDPT